jgi:hypothetical protein
VTISGCSHWCLNPAEIQALRLKSLSLPSDIYQQ